MTMSIRNLFQQAQLAEASYSLLSGVDYSDPAQVIVALTGSEFEGEFSLVQAQEFVNQWQVVHHIPDTNSGFSATLLERLDGTGKQLERILLFRWCSDAGADLNGRCPPGLPGCHRGGARE